MAEVSVQPTISKPVYDPQGNVAVTIYSTTGERKTSADFHTAFAKWQDTGEAPEGYSVQEPGVTSWFRDKFEAVSQPIQEGARKVAASMPDIPSPDISTLLKSPGAYLAMKALGPIASAVRTAVPFAASTVDTPERAGITAGIAAASPLLAPGAALGLGSKMALSIPQVLGNMLKVGGGAAIGGNLGQLATGESPTWGRTATNFAIAGLGGGVQAVVSGVIAKYISPKLQEKVATDILKTITDKYPNIINKPNVMDIAMSSQHNISKLTQQLSAGLRGTVDDITASIIPDINNVLPRNLPVADQATLRATIRRLVRASQDVLDNIHDKAAMVKAYSAMDIAKADILSQLKNSFKAMKNIKPTINKVDDIITQHYASLDNFKEGARVLSYLKEAGAGGGLDMNKFADLIRDKYMAEPGTLLEQVGRKLNSGASLVDQPTPPPAAQHLIKTAYNMLKNNTGFLGKLLPSIAEPKAGIRPLAFQIPQKMSPSATIAINESGDKAMHSYLGD